MTNKVLHLSIALLMLAPSLHGAQKKEPPKKRTFAQAAQQPGLAGILPLPEAVEAAKTKQVENTNCLSGQPASILTATQEMLARAAAAFVAKQEEPIEMQPTAQPTQDLPFPKVAKTEATKVAQTFEKLAQAANESSAKAAAALTALTKPEDAPARSEGLEPADSLTLLVIYDPKKTKGGERFELVPADTFTPFQYRVNIPTSRKKNAATDQAFATERERTRAIKQTLEDGHFFSGAITTAQRAIVTANNGVNQRPRNTTLQQAHKAGAALVAARRNNLSTVVYGPEFLNDRKELVRIDEGRKKK